MFQFFFTVYFVIVTLALFLFVRNNFTFSHCSCFYLFEIKDLLPEIIISYIVCLYTYSVKYMHKIEIDVELCRFLDNICVENAAGMYFACGDEMYMYMYIICWVLGEEEFDGSS